MSSIAREAIGGKPDSGDAGSAECETCNLTFGVVVTPGGPDIPRVGLV